MDALVRDYRTAMERCLTDPDAHRAMAERAKQHATLYYDWDAKADYTRKLYDAVLAGVPLTEFTAYR